MPYFIKARKFTADAADAVKLGDPSDKFRSRRSKRSGISKKKKKRDKMMHIGDVNQRSSYTLQS